MHYGNGTADIISRVGLHFVKHYTFGGDKLSRRESAEEWLTRFPGIVRRIVQEVDVLIYNAGADPHIEDPLGGVLTTDQLKRTGRDRARHSSGVECTGGNKPGGRVSGPDQESAGDT